MTDTSRIPFRCNICGVDAACRLEEFDREIPSCGTCGSNLRWRSLIAALTTELFGKPMALPDVPRRADLHGVGLSDAECYAGPLARHFDYTNTFYDREPRLDITAVEASHFGRYDFILSSDVFEHVPPPPQRAFESVLRMLKPGGVLVFSVPYRLDGDTKEHFPELHEFEIVGTPPGAVLVNRTRDGREQRFDDLVFHGGSGFTLEMRLFSLSGLRSCVAGAGFADLHVCDADVPEFGVLWKGVTWSRLMVARRPNAPAS